MTAPHADQLIDGYLARLRVAATDLPASVRDELNDDMRAHIVEARAREAEETDASILNILDRLGEPAVVVADARERLGLRTPGSSRTGLVEIAAVVLLPFFWIIGVILLWWSPAWKVRDKIIGTVLSLGGYPSVLFFGAFASHSLLHPVLISSCGGGASSSGDVIQTVCTGASPAEVVAAVISVAAAVMLLLLPILAAVYLAVRLRWRPRMQAVTAH
jgi:hypothetical protein